tara:strand:- start:43 stop:219 length:177 start_codon:yes stop_codon:yes gene_type:complete
MSRDMSDYIDDFVYSQVGHTNWAFLSGLKEEEIDKLEEEEKGYVEDNIFIYYEESKEE